VSRRAGLMRSIENVGAGSMPHRALDKFEQSSQYCGCQTGTDADETNGKPESQCARTCERRGNISGVLRGESWHRDPGNEFNFVSLNFGRRQNSSKRHNIILSSAGHALDAASLLHADLACAALSVQRGIGRGIGSRRARLHECAHELLHKTERRTTTTAAVRETEAEAVAFIVGQAIGLVMGTASSNYIRMYAGNAAPLTESLEVIQRTSAVILGAILSEDAASDKSAVEEVA
jgi:hypothetical protein